VYDVGFGRGVLDGGVWVVLLDVMAEEVTDVADTVVVDKISMVVDFSKSAIVREKVMIEVCHTIAELAMAIVPIIAELDTSVTVSVTVRVRETKEVTSTVSCTSEVWRTMLVLIEVEVMTDVWYMVDVEGVRIQNGVVVVDIIDEVSEFISGPRLGTKLEETLWPLEPWF